MDKKNKACLLLLLVVSINLLPITFIKSSTTGTVLDSYTTPPFSGFVLDETHPSASTDDSAVSQSINITQTSYITRIVWRLSKTNAPTGNAYAKIYAATGTHGVDAKPTGAALATSQAYDVSTLGTQAYYNFDFDALVTLTPGIYCLTYENPSAGITAVNYVRAYIDSGEPTHDGNFAYYRNGAWTPKVNQDTVFYLYGFSSEPLEYQFTDTYYENGTIYHPALNVTVSGDGLFETFNTSGGITQYYSTEPEVFSWDIGGGLTRKIYSIGEENITVTYPDGDVNAYSFGFRDYAAKIGESDSYLEALRTINGTSTVVERNIIYNSESDTVLNLVTGKTYTIRVRFSDGSYYTFGYFTPDGSTAPPTINIHGIDFTDQFQPVSAHINITMDRPNSTHIRVLYNSTLDTYNTVNVTVQIEYRNETVVYTDNAVGEDLAFHWYGAVNTTAYRVRVHVEHSYYGDIYRTVILDGVWNPYDPPDFGFIGLPSTLFSVFIVLIFLGGVSRFSAALGVFTATIVGIGLDTWGWWTMPIEIQAAGLIIAVFMKTSGRG